MTYLQGMPCKLFGVVQGRRALKQKAGVGLEAKSLNKAAPPGVLVVGSPHPRAACWVGDRSENSRNLRRLTEDFYTKSCTDYDR